MSDQAFQTLKELPIPLHQAQCVLHKHELVICGGRLQRACYSYDILKNEYKFICNYPSNVTLWGHSVVKLVDNNNNNNEDKNQITLFVWNKISNKSNEFNNYNKWVPFTDNHNHTVIIGKDDDSYEGARAVIGGNNNHLLFITYSKYISVFDLNTFQFIKHGYLLTGNSILLHCFVANPKNGQGQEIIKTDQQNYQMLLFCEKTGLPIEYDEDNNTFQFH
ncbi:hypothetical protein RFI_04984 [Reticulomyxa filosa]|uniref:Uncharacterized protein n=1 Tax=Reticulomyxa filosa TaxID=46433 RepID=X6P1K2_RETFI|nr:hypothetical protein RFI_04984 [Reticulomyxa filosa]|eukprot:ETO32131.1 hypothetical protein RFI_04984 [Reticulomyxa filosa]